MRAGNLLGVEGRLFHGIAIMEDFMENRSF